MGSKYKKHKLTLQKKKDILAHFEEDIYMMLAQREKGIESGYWQQGFYYDEDAETEEEKHDNLQTFNHIMPLSVIARHFLKQEIEKEEQFYNRVKNELTGST